jgi:Collagen triple helix repeat (20 copies)
VLSRLHDRIGTAGLVVAVVALIAALTGAAYAASGGLTPKQQKEVKNIAKKFAGKDGLPGPAGPQGPQGPKGDTGAKGADGINGTNGTNGTNGKDGPAGTNGTDGESVNIFDLPVGNANCKEGGAKFVNGTGEAFACNGEGGTGGGYPEKLPSGDNETGWWEVQGESGLIIGEESAALISFPLPVVPPPAETILITPSSTAAETTKCPGNAIEPKATPGVLCLYEGPNAAVTFVNAFAVEFGAVAYFSKTSTGFGSWAVQG